jgi:hypothetical protein
MWMTWLDAGYLDGQSGPERGKSPDTAHSGHFGICTTQVTGSSESFTLRGQGQVPEILSQNDHRRTG